jgi:hypothetical protein
MKLFIVAMLFALAFITVTTVAHAKPNPGKQCRQIGKSKVKPYKFHSKAPKLQPVAMHFPRYAYGD